MSTQVLQMDGELVLPQVASPCQRRLDTRTWHATLAVRTGDWYVGVRVNTAEAADIVESHLASVRAPEFDHKVAPNFSIEIGDPSSRRLQLVYRDHQIVARRRDVDPILGDLVTLLDDVARMMSSHRPVLDCAGVASDKGEVVLVPARRLADLLVRRQQFEDAGFTVLPGRSQVIDPDSGEVVRDLVDDALAAVAQQAGQRLSIKSWCLPGEGVVPFDLRPAEGVFLGFGAVINRYLIGAGPALHALGRLAEHTRFVALPDLSSARLAREVAALAH